MTLQEFFTVNPKVAIAFSGGVDSAYLLAEALKYAKEVRAYYVKTIFQPEFELEDAKRLAKELGADMRILTYPILNEKDVVTNPSDRCYHCKRALFSGMVAAAKADGYPVILDGTNASDDASDRPGMRALREMEVRSPLRECGLTKSMIREVSKELGLFTWKKPAYACLATRIPTGMPITAEVLQMIERAEAELFAMGFEDFRVRVLDRAMKLQFTKQWMSEAFARREEIISRLKIEGWSILLDLVPREGGL